MPLLSSAILSALATLLQTLSSPDNAARTQAEEQLNNDWFLKQPDVLLMGLVEQIEISQEEPAVRKYTSLSITIRAQADNGLLCWE